MITRIHSELCDYEVGKDGVKSIELTEHGSKKTTTYKLTYENEELLFVGLREHDVEDNL